MLLSEIVKKFKQANESGRIFNQATGRPLSKATITTNLQTVKLMEKYLRGVDADFSKPKEVENFVETFKLWMYYSERDMDSTVPRIFTRVKAMVVRYVGELPELKHLKARMNQKEVIVLKESQTEFIIKNYDKIYKECKTVSERWAIQYWITALLLNPRKSDMGSWNSRNLNDNIITYRPNKTTGAGKVIEAPVPDMLMEIFKENMCVWGTLLPPLDKNINRHLKSIAKRYNEFWTSVKVTKRGVIRSCWMWEIVHIHMMRATGVSHKLMKGMGEAYVRELSGHVHDSRSFKRYVSIQPESKIRETQSYFDSLLV